MVVDREGVHTNLPSLRRFLTMGRPVVPAPPTRSTRGLDMVRSGKNSSKSSLKYIAFEGLVSDTIFPDSLGRRSRDRFD